MEAPGHCIYYFQRQKPAKLLWQHPDDFIMQIDP